MTNWPHGSSEMSGRIRAFDWAATPLGPIALWPQSRKTAVDLMLASGHAMQLALGAERIVLYNDAYAPMLGERHPRALGIPFREAWPEIWDEIEPLVDQVFAGKTVRFEDMRLVMTRHGHAEDTWWNFSYSPVRDESGAVAGLLNVTVDTSAKHRAEQAERRAEAILEHMGDAHCVLDREFRIVSVNAAAERVLGQTRNALLGRSHWEAFPASVDAPVGRAFRRVVAERIEQHLTHHYTGEGYDLHIELDAYPTEEGGVAMFWRDVTERVRAETALRESEERQTLLLKLSDALRPLLEPSDIQAVSMRALGEQLGVMRAGYYEVDSDQETFSLMASWENDAPPLPTRLTLSQFGMNVAQGYLAGRTMVYRDAESDSTTPQGRDGYRAIEVRARIGVPLLKNGQLIAVIGVHCRAPRDWTAAEVRLVEDVAERTWEATERARSQAALREADRRKDQFLAVLSHELRNGLAPLAYQVQIGSRSLGDAARLQDAFGRADRQLQHLVHLVDDLLDVARISVGKIDLTLESVKLRDVVNMALDASRGGFDRKRHRLVVIDDSDHQLTVQGDRVRLTQVVSNLLSNATKYMDEGGTVTVRTARDGDVGLIEVSDTGIGIPAAALPRLFDLFTQVRDQQAYSEGGLGIGLSLVKQLVEMHGGSVTAASEGLGSGSTFTVRLPVAAASTESALNAQSRQDAASEVGALRVLVVDDSRDSADALAELLRLDGHEAQAAYEGVQALEMARARRPDLVLVDLGMPGMDGFEVARRLRHAFAGEPAMQIVALTGWGQEADRQRTHAASFDAHLAKPASLVELQAVISAARRAAG